MDGGNARVQVFSARGMHIRSYGSYGSKPGQFKNPVSILSDGAGLLYVADTTGGRVSVFSSSGEFINAYRPEFAGGRPAAPVTLAQTRDKKIYIEAMPGYEA